MRICIVYICAYIVLVCIGMYIYAHVHFLCACNIEPRRALFLAYLCTVFDQLLPPGSMRWPLAFCPPGPLRPSVRTFARHLWPFLSTQTFATFI